MPPPKKPDPAAAAYVDGCRLVQQHPLFAGLIQRSMFIRSPKHRFPEKGYAYVFSNGSLHFHPKRQVPPATWAYAMAHGLLHFAFDHFQPQVHQREWDLACDIVVYRFLAGLRFGQPPDHFPAASELAPFGGLSEMQIYRRLITEGIPESVLYFSLTGTSESDLRPTREGVRYDAKLWQETFARGLQEAVATTVDKVAGQSSNNAKLNKLSRTTRQARDWFVSSFPLLGAVAATFDFIEDPLVCQRGEISIAAVNSYSREIFLNPAAHLTPGELRFVIAHELLHASLRHDVRRESRDPYLWNVACDFVINLWLVEMKVGTMPIIGCLYDESLRGLSAESIYDHVARNLRQYRKLQTLRGFGLSDVIEGPNPGWWLRGDGVTLDEFIRNAIAQGLACHQAQGRGLLPAGLIEEIRALAQPPIGWDVQLAHWFDQYFPPIEKRRSYARLSRRQSSSPDIPLPRYAALDPAEARTFGVIVDTSGSMPRSLLALALGAIASYAISRDVAAVRLVSCDVSAFDHGYVLPEEIADRFELRGRGGTILQPGINLLENAPDFPEKGPLLIITDGWCDAFTVHRNHAILLPTGHSLPMTPQGPVFRFSDKA